MPITTRAGGLSGRICPIADSDARASDKKPVTQSEVETTDWYLEVLLGSGALAATNYAENNVSSLVNSVNIFYECALF